MDGKLRNMTSLYLADKDRMLMLYRVGSRVVAPSWCGIGGHFEENELNDAKACVLRELEEEMRLTQNDLDNLELRYITLRLKNKEVFQNYYFFADLREGAQVILDCREGRPEWIRFEKMGELKMPFESRCVLEHYMKVGRYTSSLYGGNATGKGILFEELHEF